MADIGGGLGYSTARPAGRLGPGTTIYATDVKVGIIDTDRPTQRHGTPPARLRCELAAAGYRELDFLLLTPADGYLAIFAAPETMPPPAALKPCRQ